MEKFKTRNRVYIQRLRLGIFISFYFRESKKVLVETTLNRARQLKMLLHHNHQKMVNIWHQMFQVLMSHFFDLFIRFVQSRMQISSYFCAWCFQLSLVELEKPKNHFVSLDFEFVVVGSPMAMCWRQPDGRDSLSLHIYIYRCQGQ